MSCPPGVAIDVHHVRSGDWEQSPDDPTHLRETLIVVHLEGDYRITPFVKQRLLELVRTIIGPR